MGASVINVFGLLEFIGQLGARYRKRDLNRITHYLQRMAQDERIILISHEGIPHTFLAISICNSYERYAEKDLWKYVAHNENGTICFVEKMASKKWTKSLRKQVEETIVERYPNIVGAVWFRPGENADRKLIYRRNHAEARH